MPTVQDIAQVIGAEVEGDGGVVIEGCAPLDDAQPGQLAYVERSRFLERAERSGAGAFIVPTDMEGAEALAPRPLLRAAHPRLAFARALALFQPDRGRPPAGRHPTSVVHENAQLGEDVALGPHVVVEAGARIGDRVALYAGVYVGPGVVIGDDTVVYPNAVLRENVKVGRRCIIHAGAVIGSDGFGYVTVDGVHEKIPHNGTVELGDDVEIGALTAVDRSTAGVTRIGSGTKIDNLVQIAHNVEMGEGCLVAALTGLAGSVRVGRYVVMGGQVAVADHVSVADGTILAGLTGVTNDTPPNTMMSGFPARPHSEQRRIWVSLRHLPDALKTIRELSQRIEELEAALGANAAAEQREGGPPAAR